MIYAVNTTYNEEFQLGCFQQSQGTLPPSLVNSHTEHAYTHYSY